MKTFIKKTLPTRLLDACRDIRDYIFGGHSIECYSQEGEDMILRRIFDKKNDGFYVDVGAHHPLRFSNTYLLYKRGWRGINIDAMPGSMKIFRWIRPLDINIESGVALVDAQFSYFEFKEKALNTFNDSLANQYISGGSELTSRVQLRARPLSDLLSEYLPKGKHIDLLTVDVEGLDLDVLRSNNWKCFRPSVLITEELRSLSGETDNSVREFLTTVGYQQFARTYNSVFYLDNYEPI